MKQVAEFELRMRSEWTRARLAELVRQARKEGWFSGVAEPARAPELDALETAIRADTFVQTPMGVARQRLELSRPECDLLWLLACIELDPSLSRAVTELVAPTTTELTIQLATRLVAIGDEAPLAIDSIDRLARSGLIEVVSDMRVPLYRRTLRCADRIIDLASGSLVLDREVARFATRPAPVASCHEAEITEIAAAISASRSLIIVHGPSDRAVADTASAGAARAGMDTLSVQCSELARDPTRIDRMVRGLVRECRLHSVVPLLIDLEALGDLGPVVLRELERDRAITVLASATTMPAWALSSATPVAIPCPPESVRTKLWHATFENQVPEVAAACAARYRIGGRLIARVGKAIVGEPDLDRVHQALRSELERDFVGLATRVETHQTWDDLVLPDDQLDLLVELVARVQCRTRVLDEWGFGAKVGRGVGLSVLLSGPPGTGKTMIAGLVAKELGLDLYQIDLSKVVSKYIGETEKQLAKLFDAAECGHAILLFDEADALFGKRTEVRSSNDRYANLEVNYLLQRIDAFTGIAMLTTNHESAMDEAFKRRIAIHLRIPMPSDEQQGELWKRMLPPDAAVAEQLGIDRIAETFSMSGGYIKNAVIRAAYFAASRGADGVITHRDLVRAARAEYDAMGKIA